jgi:hypothetical protein
MKGRSTELDGAGEGKVPDTILTTREHYLNPLHLASRYRGGISVLDLS